MSADNGVYILKTKIPGYPGTYAYRVRELSAIDNLEYATDYGYKNGTKETMLKNAKEMWKGCQVFFTEEEALVVANQIYLECDICEYGISQINDLEDEIFDNKDLDRYQAWLNHKQRAKPTIGDLSESKRQELIGDLLKAKLHEAKLHEGNLHEGWKDSRKEVAMPNQDSKFWIIWNPSGKNPSFRHSTKESADTEAHRLASLHKGNVFYVLEGVERFESSTVKKTSLI